MLRGSIEWLYFFLPDGTTAWCGRLSMFQDSTINMVIKMTKLLIIFWVILSKH